MKNLSLLHDRMYNFDSKIYRLNLYIERIKFSILPYICRIFMIFDKIPINKVDFIQKKEMNE